MEVHHSQGALDPGVGGVRGMGDAQEAVVADQEAVVADPTEVLPIGRMQEHRATSEEGKLRVVGPVSKYQ